MSAQDSRSQKLKFCRLSFLICLVLLSHLAGEVKAREVSIKLSFSDALRMARKRQIKSIVAEKRVLQSLQRIRQAKSVFYPQLEASSYQYRRVFNLESVGINLGLPNFDPLVGPFNTFDARIYLTQSLFDGPALSRLKEARLGKYLSLAEQKKARLDAMALVANLFIEAHRAQERVPLIRTWLRRDTKYLQLSKTRKSLGLGSDLELSQAQAAYQRTQSQLVSAQSEALERRLDLAAALGLEQDRPISFVLDKRIDHMSLPHKKDFSSLVAHHPEVESAQIQVEQRRQEQKTRKAEYYPKLMANADYGVNGRHPGNADDTYNFGGQLSLPLYEGGLRKASLREARRKTEESSALWEDTWRQQEAKASSALANLEQSLKAFQAAKTELRVAGQELALAKGRLHSGLGSQWQVIEAQARQASAQDQKEEAVAIFYLARVNLAHATGTLSSWIPQSKD